MKVLIIFALVAHICNAGLIIDAPTGDKNKPGLLEEHSEQQQQTAQYQQQQQQVQQQQKHHHRNQHSHNNNQDPQPNYEQQHPQPQPQQQQQQQHFQQPPLQYVIVRSQTDNQRVPNHVTVHRDPHIPPLGDHIHLTHIVEPHHHQQVPDVEVPDTQGTGAQNVAVHYVPEQYNPQQVFVQHSQVAQQPMLLQPVPQYVPQYVQPPLPPQQPQYIQPYKNGAPIVRVNHVVQQQQKQSQPQQHPQISANEADLTQQVQEHITQIVPNYSQQSVPQQAVHHITRPEVSEVEQPQQYYPEVPLENQHVYLQKNQQPQIVSHIIVPIAGHHQNAMGVYAEAVGHQAQGVPSQVQVTGQRYPVQQGVGGYVVNQQTSLRAYPVIEMRGVEVGTESQDVDHSILQQVPQKNVPRKPNVTYNPHVVVQGIPSTSETYIPLQSHQYQKPEQHPQMHHQLVHHQKLQPISHAASHSSLSSSAPALPSSQPTGSSNSATKNRGM